MFVFKSNIINILHDRKKLNETYFPQQAFQFAKTMRLLKMQKYINMRKSNT